MASVMQRMSMPPVRPWKEFANTSKLQLPNFSNPNVVLQRLQSNLVHWAGNYLVVSGVIFGYGLFAAPLMIVAVGFVFLAYSYFVVINSTPMHVAGTELNTKHKIGGVVAITVLLFFFTSGLTILWVAGCAAALVLVHALLRQPSLGTKVSSFFDNFSDAPSEPVSISEIADTLQDLQSDAEEQQVAARREEWNAQRDQYHQFASQLRAKYDLTPAESKDTV